VDDMLNPANPLSPLSSVHPLNTETEVVAPLPRQPQGIQFDPTVDYLTLVLLGVAALLLAGLLWKRWRDRVQWRKMQRLAILEMEQELRAELDKPKQKPECQSCSSFIGCSMAGVKTCPLVQH